MNELAPLAKVLSIYVDESGNFDFSRNGTRYFILSAVSTNGCPTLPGELHALKHAIASSGADIQRFHAAEDRRAVRDQVFDVLARYVDHVCFSVDAVVVQNS